MNSLAEVVAKSVSLNPEQENAADHFSGPCFVSACPGAGKTRIIVERTLRLIQKGVNPKTILCITFTNKAANEMKERIVKRIGKIGEEVYVSTFHALCANIIRRYGDVLGYGYRTNILDDEDQEGLMAQCARQMGLEFSSVKIRGLVADCGKMRENLIPEEDFDDFVKNLDDLRLIQSYIQKMRKTGVVDFSGILSETIRLFENYPEILNTVRSRFDYIQVDEVQDTNYAQFKIVQMIGSHNNVLIVGDADQGIYSWRGARYKNIEDFVSLNNAKVIYLPQNYRSTPEIVSAAAKLIKNNPNRKQTLDFKTSNPSGKDVQCYVHGSPESEGNWIACEIKRMIDSGVYKPHDFAVLYRLNSMSRAIEQGLVSAGVKYQVIGGFSFFDRAEVRDSISVLRFLVNPSDGTALARFVNKPGRNIGEATLGKIENFAEENNISLIESMKRAKEHITSGANKDKIIEACERLASIFEEDYSGKSIGEVLATLLRKIEYRKFLESKYDSKEYEDRQSNVQELINSCALYSEKRGNDIGSYLSNIALQSSSDKETKEDMVTLMSLHASKGLEFPVVFLPCLEEGQMPHKRAIMERDGLEEERRLAYVGMTRAQKELYLSHSSARMQRYSAGAVRFDKVIPSRFLREAGITSAIRIADYDKYNLKK